MHDLNDHRICFIGDSFVQGTSDPECRGWVGRISAAARLTGVDVTAYNLGIRRDTSSDIAARWENECRIRFRADSKRYLLFSFGANDMTMENGKLRVAQPESIANFTRIVSKASGLYQTLVVGPAPVGTAEEDARILELCAHYAQRAKELGVPYLPVAAILAANSIWTSEARVNDGAHPASGGYQLLADLVAAWPAWWFSADTATRSASPATGEPAET